MIGRKSLRNLIVMKKQNIISGVLKLTKGYIIFEVENISPVERQIDVSQASQAAS